MPTPPVTRTALRICPLCEATCGLEVGLSATDEVVRIRGDRDDVWSAGYLCPKGPALKHLHEDPDRLRTPLVRRDGRLVEAGWDEAFAEAGRLLGGVVATHGRRALAAYLGNPSVHNLAGQLYVKPLVKALGTGNVFTASTVDQRPKEISSALLFGTPLSVPVPDVDRTDHLLLLGANPLDSNGSLATAPDWPGRLAALRARGGRLVVVDPRRTPTAGIADEHVSIRPGADPFLLFAMLNVLATDGLVDPGPAGPWLTGLDTVLALAEPFTPEAVEPATGIPAATVRRLARQLAAAPTACVYGRIGTTTAEFGTLTSWLVDVLNAATGNLDRPGGAMFAKAAAGGANTRGEPRTGRPLRLGRYRSRVRGLPETLGELPVVCFAEEIDTPGEGQIRGLVTVAGNPVLSTPDGSRLEGVLPGLDFMAAVDIYVNETTRHADVILPPTTALERDHYDLVFHLLAVRDTARFTPAVFEKDAGQRHDWQIFREITLRTTARLTRKAPLKKRVVQRARLTASPTFLIAQLLRRGSSGVTMRKLRARPAGIDLGPLRGGQLPERLPSKGKRIDLAPDLVVRDVVRLGAVVAPAEDELLLIGRRHKQDCNSWMHNSERLTRGRPRHQLLMNPSDLAERDIVDGARVRVTSRIGSVEVEVASSDDLMPGVVSLPHGYGHARDGVLMTRSREVAGVSINDLTDPELLDVSGNAALNGVPVSVTPAG
jgi:anaerobic selenocysteine-containing dehydrogenase